MNSESERDLEPPVDLIQKTISDPLEPSATHKPTPEQLERMEAAVNTYMEVLLP
ncbi:MAG: hypothetical protein HC933_07685 [Pleurocapsa sp. SU_196_0]|nr:hypothetical protein [Pleurocapsa sp. SU_196_0]